MPSRHLASAGAPVDYYCYCYFCHMQELQPCTVCNGAAWEPAQPETFDLQAVPFEEPPTPSDETPRKGRQRKGGRPLSQAARDKIRATMKGRRWTEEHRRCGHDTCLLVAIGLVPSATYSCSVSSVVELSKST